MTYKMIDEYQKILTKMLGEKWHDNVEVHPYPDHLEEFYSRCRICNVDEYHENIKFTTDSDMMKVFRWLVVNGKWEKFYYWAFEYAAKDETYSAWLFYDAERFCCLAAMAKKEGVT